MSTDKKFVEIWPGQIIDRDSVIVIQVVEGSQEDGPKNDTPEPHYHVMLVTRAGMFMSHEKIASKVIAEAFARDVTQRLSAEFVGNTENFLAGMSGPAN